MPHGDEMWHGSGGDAPAAVLSVFARSPLFQDLPEEAVRGLAASAEPVHFSVGMEVLRQGGPPSAYLHLVESGAARIEAAEPGQPDAQPQVVETCGSGDVFGAASLLDTAPDARARYTVRVVEELRCYRVPRADVMELVARFPALADALSERTHRLLRVARAELAAHADSMVVSRKLDVGLQSLVAPVQSLVRRPPVFCDAATTVAEAARLMTAHGVGSILVVDGNQRPTGIVTDTDLRREVVAREQPTSMPVSAVMSHPVLSLPAASPAMEALRLMSEQRVRHLVIVDDAGLAVGVISARDLLLVQGQSPMALLHRLESAADLDELAEARAHLSGLLAAMVRVGIEPEMATRVITTLNDRATRRALAWAEQETTTELREEAGGGFEPPRYCWLALGSEGRQEQTFTTDQDNAIIHTAAPDDAAARRWLERFAGRAIASLERIGFPRCPGNVMATNPAWRRSLDEWRFQVVRWMEEPGGEELLRSTIFFDLRPLHGDASLAEALWDTVLAGSQQNAIFLAHLSRNAARVQPPLNFLGNFSLERRGRFRHTLNLKERGMGLLVDCARVLALAHGVTTTHTMDRLAAVAPRGLSADLSEDARAAFSFLMLVRLQNHLAQQERGEQPNNHLNPDDLPPFQRRSLKLAFQVVQTLQGSVAQRFGGNRLG